MSYPRFGNRYYRVSVQAPGRTWVRVGEYHNAPNAVFGLMRKMRLERLEDLDFLKIEVEVLPPRPRRMAKAAYMRQLRETHEFGAVLD